jgi:hypothetical protein
MLDKDHSRIIRSVIGRVLMSQWDPIGVHDEPAAADEYDSYVSGIYDLLNRKASAREIGAHLEKIEKDRMGLIDLRGNPLLPSAKREQAVTALQEAFNSFQK